MTLDDSLLATARAWRAEDPDPVTAEELSVLITRAQNGDPEAVVELVDAFDVLIRAHDAAQAAPAIAQVKNAASDSRVRRMKTSHDGVVRRFPASLGNAAEAGNLGAACADARMSQ